MNFHRDSDMWHHTIRFILIRIFYPCLMVFGTIGNILCLKILLRKRFRRQSTCQYLCVLAVIDILFIYMRSTRYLYRHIYHVDLRNTSLWICRTFIFFSSTLSHLASWILVVVSFDRYFIMTNLVPRRNGGARVIRSTCILILIICALNTHYFHILGINMKLRVPLGPAEKNLSNETTYIATRFVCIARTQFKNFFRLYLPIFDLLFVAIIPCILMIFANIGIIRITMRSNMLQITSKKQKRNNRVTIMLLSVIFAFILLTCPSVIYICLNRLTSSTTFTDTKLVLIDVLESLWYTKHALNFILYTLSGQDFRREFRKLISCSHRSASSALHHHHHHHQRRPPHTHAHRDTEHQLISMNSYVSSYRSPSIPNGSLRYSSEDPCLPDNQYPLLFHSTFDQNRSSDGQTEGSNSDVRVIKRSSTLTSPMSGISEQEKSSS